jgi:acyl transferase domain-containing protein/NADPH:quinone reductase-like Zn-dependent oxidoreductase/acyl-coenzyme A synthetase/AMP-(fatty) acid ligase/NAD(P)-dependent dehydrogenase (short-subunit alcohol dehydrogenase family)/acyl carrier protein
MIEPERGSQGGVDINEGPIGRLGVAIRDAAQRNPDRVALVDDEEERSYGELAALLEVVDAGAAPRRAAAIGRSVVDVETILLAGFAGESLLLLDEGTTAWELERAEAIFTDGFEPSASDESGPVVGLCSSGSSGLPKVVELEWESLLLNAVSFAAAAGYGENDVLWCTTPLAHLYCLGVGVLGGLLSGATVVLGKGMLGADEFAGIVSERTPTALLSVPFLFNRYLGLIESDPAIVAEWPLRMAIAAGEPVSPRLIAAWREATGAPLRSHYGLTEGGQITLATGGAKEGVGCPLDDVEVRIGERGEVAVRRLPPGRPYRIVGQEPVADGWYETGDLGRLDEHGNLHITGRADSRLNVAGKKIDPMEVEEALRGCEGVEDCAVAAIDGPSGPEVAAFLRPLPDREPDDVELRTELAKRLSPHKLPRRFVRVLEIPRTLTGKVRRGELIAGLGDTRGPRAADGDPDPDLLRLVRAEAATVVLGHATADAIESRRTFKELGFDSLTAVALCERLTELTGVQVPATAVFDHPTPVALARFLAAPAPKPGAAVAASRPATMSEPIAIVGMACRFAGGVASPADLWDLVASGHDGIGPFPVDRGWDLEGLFDPDPDSVGTSYVKEGGFIDGSADFDAEFFGIGPREALAMDPQQRLLLEVAWEAFEHAEIDPSSLRGSSTGTFAGVMMRDYGQGEASLPGSAEGHVTTGLSESVVSGRVAYTFGFEGPAVTVNTACSSSLVATHLACQALRTGECGLALAGGVSVISTPAEFVEFSRQRVLARDARCKAFAASADGTGFSDGVGLLLLERYSDARRNGHRILATIRGSAINQDGASNGLTAPSGPSQERVIRQALANARLAPEDVDAIEAHGTGTALGDPIEAGALLAAYGKDRPSPLMLGSVKSNIGHSLAAAGVAGTIKMVEAMRHGVLPASLHVDEPSPHVEWSAGGLELLTEAQPWRVDGGPRRAGISSFGISGTNAHVIIEEVPASEGDPSGAALEPRRQPLPGVFPLVISAKSEGALRDSARRLAARLAAEPELDPADVAHTLLATRASLEHRAAVVGQGRDDLLAALDGLARGETHPDLAVGRSAGERAPVFCFPGQGSQWQGMAAGLAGGSAFFDRCLDECEEAFAPYLDWSLRDVVLGVEGAPSIERIEVVQPALFATMVCLARLWKACGVEPAATLGHSQGEIAAVHIAGGLTLDDAARISALRSRMMAKLVGQGAMVSVALPAAEIEQRLGPWSGRVEVAAENGPSSVILSVEGAAVAELLERCEREEVRARKLSASMPSHSAAVEPFRDELLEVLAPIDPRPGEVPFYSSVTGGLLDTRELGPEYWYRNMRQPVLFERVTRELARSDRRVFIEVSPHPVFALALRETLEAELGDADRAAVIGTLRRDEGGARRFALSLAEAHAVGAELDPAAFFAGSTPKRIALPGYPFQRNRYWPDAAGAAGDLRAAGLADAEHPLLAAAIEDPDGDGVTLAGRLSFATHGWLADHAVFGVALLPGSAFVDLAVAAGSDLGTGAIEELVQEAPLILDESSAAQIRLTIGDADAEGRRGFSLHSRVEGSEAGWIRNATGTLVAAPVSHPDAGAGEWPPAGAEPVDLEHFYADLAERGYSYGPAFQGLRRAWRLGEEIYTEVELGQAESEQVSGFALHPALLDVALHASFLRPDAQQLGLPFSWRDVVVSGGGGTALRVRLSPEKDGFSLSATDPAGEPVVSVGNLTLRPAREGQFADESRGSRDSLFHIAWKQVAMEKVPIAGDVDVLRCEPEPGADPPAAALATAERVLAAVQERIPQRDSELRPLAVVTNGAVAARVGEVPDLATAPIWGLLRSAQAELPGGFVLVDTDGSEASEAALSAAIASGEPELALREGRLLAARLERSVPQSPAAVAGAPWRLDIDERGSLDNISVRSFPDANRPLAAGEVRIAVHAAGLNFRDVLVALDMVPGDEPLGGEGAGKVLEIGSKVRGLAPGDRVVGVFEGAFGPIAIADARTLARIPGGWSFSTAASVPIVFLTAHYGLTELARLQAGERVLIHSAAGGVGTAAVQLARHLGAEVFATAHPDKWDALRALGVDDEHIASSRDRRFEDCVNKATGGEGVDVVLNSLAGELVDASLGLLREGGRFLEMGKTDIRDSAQVATEHPGVAYRAYDLIDAGPERIGSMLSELLELFDREVLRPPPIRNWDVRQGIEAFRFMSQARHVGKIVLTVPQARDPNATVLITGGTGTIGGTVARHFVEKHGARRLLLVSRNGPQADGAKELVEELELAGAEAEVVACDVSDRRALADLIADIPAEHPLGTVVHSAGAIDDGLIGSLTPERLRGVFGPKVDAGWHLHELTAASGSVEIVFFSSVAATLGSPGQANYAAANSFLDGLTARRKAEGLSGVTIAWGFWARPTGLSKHLTDVDRTRIARMGLRRIEDGHGLHLFDAASNAMEPLAIAAPMDLVSLRSQARSGVLSPILSELVSGVGRPVASNGSSRRSLAMVSAAEREKVARELVCVEAASVLGHSDSAAIDVEKTFKQLGFDSLTGVELRNRLRSKTGLRLSSTIVFDHPSPAAVATHLCALSEGSSKPGTSIDAEIEKIEARLAAGGSDEKAHALARLQALIAQVSSDGEADGVDDSAYQDLESVSDDEVIKLIDEEFGVT